MKYLRLLSFTVISSILITGCTPPEQQATDAEGQVTDSAVNTEILVRTSILEKTTIARTIDYNATLQAWEELYVAPAVPGRIEKIYVEPGDRVEMGQNLFLMDQTQLHQSRIQLKSLEVDLKRMEELLKSGSITQQAYDQLKTQSDVTKSSLEYLENNTKLVAPFSGIITGKYYENGEIYSGAPNTMVGKAAIVTLMQVDKLKAVLNITEGLYPLVRTGMKSDVMVDVFGKELFEGKVTLIYPVVDPMSRSFTVEIQVPNTTGKLKPGMFARVSMFIGEEETFVVPANTVLQQEGTNIRYIFLEKDGAAQRYNVTIGKRFDEKVEIISDEVLEGGKLIIEGQTKLMNGSKIKVVE